MPIMQLVLALGLLAMSGAATAPEAVVKDLYAGHFANQQRWDLTLKRARARFAPALLVLLEADARAAAASSDDIVGLDFDPLTNAQEEADAFTVGPARVNGAEATVAVELRTGQERTTVTAHLSSSSGAWLISDLDYGGATLSATLKELAKERGGQ